MPARTGPAGHGPTRAVGVLIVGILALVLVPTVASSVVGAAPQSFALTLEPGTGTVRLGTNPEPLIIGDPTTVAGTLDGGFDGTGAVTGVSFSTPTIEFQQSVGDAPVDIVARFSQPTLGSGVVVTEDDGRASVAVDMALALRLDIDVADGAILATCHSAPIQLKLRSPSSAPYDPATGLVTVTDPQFVIPPVVAGDQCIAIVATAVNQQLASPDNAISMTLRGALDLPPPPGEPTVTTVAAAANPTLLGFPASFTATVSPGEGVEAEQDPTGEVEFFIDGDQSLGRVALNAARQATLATSSLPTGLHQVTARYLGDPVFSGSQSAPLEHTVQATPHVTAVVPSELVVGAPPEDTQFTALITNPISGAPQANLRVDFQFGTLASMANGHLVLSYESAPDTWTPVTLTGTTNQTGSYGGLTGFALAPGESRQVTFRLSAIATARQGPLPVAIRLTSVHPDTGAVVTTFSTKNSTTQIVPAERRATSFGAVTPGAGMPSPLQTRQGYSIGFQATITRGGATPLPNMTGCVQLFVDGVLMTHVGGGHATVESNPEGCRVPATNGAVTFYLPRLFTRTLSPGTHTAQLSFPGDAFYQPSMSIEVPFTVLAQPAARPYQCVYNLGGLIPTTLFYGARVEVLGGVPAVAVAGTNVSLARPILRVTAELNTANGANNVLTAWASNPVANRVAFVDLAGQVGSGSFEALALQAPAPTGTLDHTNVYTGIQTEILVEGAPGEAVDVTLDGFGFVGGNGARYACAPVGAAESLGQITVAGTTVAADRISGVVGDPITLTSNVFPSTAQGQVEFFDGETSLGIAPVEGGTAAIRTRALPAGERVITARHLGDVVQPPTTSEPIIVTVRAIACSAFAQPGHAAVVRLTYLELLRRCPDQAGFDYWKGRLDAGTTPETFARAIVATPEALGVVVDDGYRTMLGRRADGAGRTFWVGRLQAHGRYDQLLADLAASDEFWALSGATNQGFVTRVYERLLDRAPDVGGLDFWVGRLDAGTSRRTLVLSLANLDEPLGRLVVLSYDQILARAPDGPERVDGVTFLRRTGDRSGFYAQLIGRPEFSTRAQEFPNPS